MKGICIKCGAENVDIHPFPDSAYYKMCFLCQMKKPDGEKEEKNDKNPS